MNRRLLCKEHDDCGGFDRPSYAGRAVAKEKLELPRVWGYGDRSDGFKGAFKTREEAIAEGQAVMDSNFEIAAGFVCEPAEFLPTFDEINEIMYTKATDELGDAAEDFPDVSPEGKEALRVALAQWAQEFCECTFWRPIESTIEAVDHVFLSDHDRLFVAIQEFDAEQDENRRKLSESGGSYDNVKYLALYREVRRIMKKYSPEGK